MGVRSYVDMVGMCNGVTHPNTKEEINKYHKFLKDTNEELWVTWIKAMCKELGQLAQGYGDTTGTNTITFMTHEQIRAISMDHTVTYACIIVDYRL